MYRVGQYIVYGSEGVCRVEAIGPVDVRGAKPGQEYYTLSLVYRQGRVYLPVDAAGYSRPILTAEEAQALLLEIPSIPTEVFVSANPRLLGDQYQRRMKSGNCRDQLVVIRSIRAKGADIARKGRKLGMVDERGLKQTEEKLSGELALSLDISLEEARALLTRWLEEGATE